MPELRKEPVTGRWVIVSTDRAKRPMDFAAPAEQEPDNHCPFCERQESQTAPEIYADRPHDTKPNQPGWRVRVVPNIQPVLRIEGEMFRRARGLYDVMNGIGAHETLIETPQHVANIADLSEDQITAVMAACRHRIADLGKDERFKYVLMFKNYGAAAGATRFRHTRAQLIATPVTPKRVKEELEGTKRYFDYRERCLYCDIIAQEREMRVRVVHESAHCIVLAPFASRFPFELCLLPKRHASDFETIRPEEQRDLAAVMKLVLSKLKTILADPPYNYILHTAPFHHRPNKGKTGYWATIADDYHWHIEIMPRLTRVAGFEWGSGFYINPTPPEEAAKYLRETDVQAPAAAAGTH